MVSSWLLTYIFKTYLQTHFPSSPTFLLPGLTATVALPLTVPSFCLNWPQGPSIHRTLHPLTWGSQFLQSSRNFLSRHLLGVCLRFLFRCPPTSFKQSQPSLKLPIGCPGFHPSGLVKSSLSASPGSWVWRARHRWSWTEWCEQLASLQDPHPHGMTFSRRQTIKQKTTT